MSILFSSLLRSKSTKNLSASFNLFNIFTLTNISCFNTITSYSSTVPIFFSQLRTNIITSFSSQPRPKLVSIQLLKAQHSNIYSYAVKNFPHNEQLSTHFFLSLIKSHCNYFASKWAFSPQKFLHVHIFLLFSYLNA